MRVRRYIPIVKVIEYMRALPFNAGKCRVYVRHVDRDMLGIPCEVTII